MQQQACVLRAEFLLCLLYKPCAHRTHTLLIFLSSLRTLPALICASPQSPFSPPHSPPYCTYSLPALPQIPLHHFMPHLHTKFTACNDNDLRPQASTWRERAGGPSMHVPPAAAACRCLPPLPPPLGRCRLSSSESPGGAQVNHPDIFRCLNSTGRPYCTAAHRLLSAQLPPGGGGRALGSRSLRGDALPPESSQQHAVPAIGDISVEGARETPHHDARWRAAGHCACGSLLGQRRLANACVTSLRPTQTANHRYRGCRHRSRSDTGSP